MHYTIIRLMVCFPDAHAYNGLFDWIESKSGRPISNDSVLIFHNQGEAFQDSSDYHFCKLILEKYPELTLILCSGSTHGTITSRSTQRLYGAYKNFYKICDNDWYGSFNGQEDPERNPDYLKNIAKEKTFVYIGGGLRWHRKLILYNLCHYDLLDHGFVTYNIQPVYPHIGNLGPDGTIQNYDLAMHDMWVERNIGDQLPSTMSLYDDNDLTSGEYPVFKQEWRLPRTAEHPRS